MDNAPIGVFDSGLGGLTVARAIMDKLPDEEVVYLGDTANAPYGPRTIADVRHLTLACLDVLASRGVKMIVIACNTATAAALSDARERYWIEQHIPVVEVITPAARRAVLMTRNRRVGVIGTQATIQSEAYLNALAAVPDLRVTSQACPRFVEFVENGITTGDELQDVATKYLQPLTDAGVDTLILGCTHYPLLTGAIGRVMGEGVDLVTSSEATANVTYNRLVDAGLLHERRPLGSMPHHQFLTTGSVERFGALARRFLGPEVLDAHQVKATFSSAMDTNQGFERSEDSEHFEHNGADAVATPTLPAMTPPAMTPRAQQAMERNHS